MNAYQKLMHGGSKIPQLATGVVQGAATRCHPPVPRFGTTIPRIAAGTSPDCPHNVRPMVVWPFAFVSQYIFPADH